MKKVLAIVRASTDRQETESQKLELCSYLERYGYSKESIVVIEVSGASAYKKNQKYLMMLDDIKTTITNDPEIEAVGLWNLDRLGRVDDCLIEMKNWFINHKIQLYCKSPSFVLLNEDGTVNGGAEIAYGVFASLVKQQTEDLFNKWKRGKDRNAKEGKYNGGHTLPTGFTVNEEGYIVPDPVKSKIIYKVFSLYAENKNINFIKEYMASVGINMSNSHIHFVLRNKSYRGKLIDEELFDKVQEIKKNNRNEGKSKKFNLAERMIVCPECGHHFTMIGGRNWKCIYHTSSYKGSDKYCSFVGSLHGGYVDYILRESAAFLEAKSIVEDNAEKRIKIKEELDEIPLKIEVQKDIINAISSKLEKLTDSYVEGLIDKDKMKKKAEIIKDSEKKALKEIEQLNVKKTVLEEELSKTSEHSYDNINTIGELKEKLLYSPDMYVFVRRHIERIDVDRSGNSKILTLTTKSGEIKKFKIEGIGAGSHLYVLDNQTFRRVEIPQK